LTARRESLAVDFAQGNRSAQKEVAQIDAAYDAAWKERGLLISAMTQLETLAEDQQAAIIAADDEDVEDNFADEETEAKKFSDLERDTNDLVRIAKVAEGSGAHALRDAALAKTMGDVEAEITKLGGLQPVRYPREETVALLQHNRDSQQEVHRG